MSEATAPMEVGQEPGEGVGTVAAGVEAAEDAKILVAMKRWLPSVITGGGLLVGIISTGVMFSMRLDALEKTVIEIKQSGSPPVQVLQSRMGAMDVAVMTNRAERIKDHELLLKIDRKLSLLICKGDPSKCSE